MEGENTVKIENIGGVPIILSLLKEVGLAEKIDRHYPSHGNWEGLSKGQVVSVWLGYIISNCDHRLSHVSDWVSSLEMSLGQMLGSTVRPEDLSDDKLGHLLDEFGDMDRWVLFEKEINRNFIRAYELNTDIVQLDPTVGKSFKKVVEDGLFQYGSSKHFRKDLPQFKTILANLEGGNMPLTSITVSGQTADDVLYIPAIEQAKASLLRDGILWVGDVKLGSLGNRAYIAKTGDYYLSPLSKVQLPGEILLSRYLEPVLEGKIELEEISRNGKVIARGYETTQDKEHEGQQWTERQLIVLSEQYANSQKRGLEKRLNRAVEKIEKLNGRGRGKKRYKTEEDLQAGIAKIISDNKVGGLIEVGQKVSYREKQVKGYKGKPPRVERKMDYQVAAAINAAAVAEKKSTLGWRVYVTNHDKTSLPLEKAIELYREEYKIERRIRNLKEEVTKLLPIYLQKDNRIKGLINLLVLALKIIAGFEYKVAQELAKTDDELGGIYAGNPKITTPTPTINKMMGAFKNFSVVFIHYRGKIVQIMCEALNAVQLKILKLAGINKNVFNLNKSGVFKFNSA